MSAPGHAPAAAAPSDGQEGGGPSGEAYARRLRRTLAGLLILAIAVAGFLAAMPGLGELKGLIEHAEPGWVLAAIGLEYLSCTGYVLTVMLAFPRGRPRPTGRLAWSELAANAMLPAGGLGGLGLGAWILTRRGVSSARIAERSTVIFLLTSAVSVATLILTGLGLGLGVLPGPRQFTLTFLPAAIGLGAIAATLIAARWAQGAAAHTSHIRVAALFSSLARGIRATLAELKKGDWKLVGALGYFAFDVGTLAAAFAAIGHSPSLGALTMGYLIGQLAGLIPIPGGLGVVEGGLLGALSLYGIPFAPAAAAVILYRAIWLLLPSILGTIAFLILRRDLEKPLVLKPPAGG